MYHCFCTCEKSREKIRYSSTTLYQPKCLSYPDDNHHLHRSKRWEFSHEDLDKSLLEFLDHLRQQSLRLVLQQTDHHREWNERRNTIFLLVIRCSNDQSWSIIFDIIFIISSIIEKKKMSMIWFEILLTSFSFGFTRWWFRREIFRWFFLNKNFISLRRKFSFCKSTKMSRWRFFTPPHLAQPIAVIWLPGLVTL